jgi:hypothetical protein
LDGSDECKLFGALRNRTQGNSSLTVIIEELIVQIRITLKLSGWSKTQKHAKLHKQFKKFFKDHPEIDEEDFDDSVEIDGSFSLGALREVFKVTYKTTRLRKVISGSTDDDCELLFKMKKQANNESNEITQRLQLNQLHDVIQAKFSIEIDMQIRLQYVSEQIWQCLQQSPFVIELLMDIKMSDLAEPITPANPQPSTDCSCDDGDDGKPEFGDIYELSYISHYCSNGDSCGDVNGEEGVEPTAAPTSSTPAASSSSSDAPSSSSAAPSSSSDAPSSSSAAPSSSSDAPSSSSAAPSSSSVAPSSSSAAAETSTAASTASSAPPVDCPKRADTIVKNGNQYGNASWLEYSIEVVFRGWNLQMRTAYQSTFNNIKYCINEASGNVCVGQSYAFKITKLVFYMTSYSQNNQVYHDAEMNIPIKGGSSHGFYGKIKDFCDCA